MEIIKCLVALQPDQLLLQLDKPEANGQRKQYTPLEIARVKNHRDIVSLLVKFKDGYVTTSHHMQLELGLSKPCAADLFAHVVFLCDDLLKITSKPPPREPPRAPARITQETPLKAAAAVAERETSTAKYNAAIRLVRLETKNFNHHLSR